MIVLLLEGWGRSFGVKLQMKFREKNQKPIHYMELASILAEDYCALSLATAE